jgi:hypothetical protein
MTTAQRIIAAMGIVLIFGRFLSAPYRFQGHDPLYLARTGEERVVLGRVHAPLWAPPGDAELLAKARVRMRDPELQLERVSIDVDWLRLGAWVAAIGVITVLAIGAPSSRSRDSRAGGD